MMLVFFLLLGGCVAPHPHMSPRVRIEATANGGAPMVVNFDLGSMSERAILTVLGYPPDAYSLQFMQYE